MNYVKAQQEILAYILTAATDMRARGVQYIHDDANGTTTLFNPEGTFGYTFPDKLIGVDLNKCQMLKKLPNICPVEAEYEIIADGSTVRSTDGKKTLAVYKTAKGDVLHIDKKLVDKFGKGARFYTEEYPKPITVTDGNLIIGYVMPCRPPKND